MGWTMLYLFVFLKLPIVAACLIVWWAVRQGTDEELTRNDGGSPKPRRPHPRPRRPRPPRPGPRAPAPAPPWRPRLRRPHAPAAPRPLRNRCRTRARASTDRLIEA